MVVQLLLLVFLEELLLSLFLLLLRLLAEGLAMTEETGAGGDAELDGRISAARFNGG